MALAHASAPIFWLCFGKVSWVARRTLWLWFPSAGAEPQPCRGGGGSSGRAAGSEPARGSGAAANPHPAVGLCPSPRTLQALVHAPVNAQAVLLLLHAPLAAAVVQGFLLESFHGAPAFVLGLQARGPAEVALFAGYTLPQCPEFSTTALLLQTLIAGFHAVQAVPSRQPAHFCRQKYIYGEETQTNTHSLREEGAFNPSIWGTSSRSTCSQPQGQHLANLLASCCALAKSTQGLDPLSGSPRKQYFFNPWWLIYEETQKGKKTQRG